MVGITRSKVIVFLCLFYFLFVKYKTEWCFLQLIPAAGFTQHLRCDFSFLLLEKVREGDLLEGLGAKMRVFVKMLLIFVMEGGVKTQTGSIDFKKSRKICRLKLTGYSWRFCSFLWWKEAWKLKLTQLISKNQGKLATQNDSNYLVHVGGVLGRGARGFYDIDNCWHTHICIYIYIYIWATLAATWIASVFFRLIFPWGILTSPCREKFFEDIALRAIIASIRVHPGVTTPAIFQKRMHPGPILTSPRGGLCHFCWYKLPSWVFPKIGVPPNPEF